MLLYYFVIAFGILLIAFASLNLNRTKKLVSPYQTKAQKRKLWSQIVEGLGNIGTTWFNYLAGTDRSKLTRNLIIMAVAGAISLVLNKLYLQIDVSVFLSALAVFFIFVVWFLGKRHNRQVFEDSFPEVIQVVNSAISAGIGILQAIERCGENVQGEFGTEFKNIYKRLSIGEDVDSIFLDSYSRYPYKEYYYFITIIKLNLSRGGQLKEVITRLSRIIADSKKMEKRKRALTSEARMSAMIVACFPIGFMIFMRFMMPQDFEFLLTNPKGQMIFYYVLGSEILGMLIIWLLMRKST